MTSKIINMVERIKDKEERRLEALFRSDPVPDDGFSRRIVTRVRRRIWIRRLLLPSAFVIGGLFAFKPVSEFVAALSKILTVIPTDFVEIPAGSLSQLPTFMAGAAILMAALMFVRALEE